MDIQDEQDNGALIIVSAQFNVGLRCANPTYEFFLINMDIQDEQDNGKKELRAPPVTYPVYPVHPCGLKEAPK
jgi:hypothetical protein